MPLSYFKHERIWLKQHPDFSERWLQQRIAEDPAILGLGELELKDKERTQPRAGRLDLLLQDPEQERRYEVEIQLGKTDEAHIIRTIEYWDYERRRFPQYQHVAVIVAEDITSRFLSVISLFNGFIPLIAIQLNAVRLGDQITLVATRVLDETTLGPDDDADEAQVQTDRTYWEERSSPESLALVDRIFDLVREIDPQLQLKYNKYYIGLSRNDQAVNFAVFRPKKEFVRLEMYLERSDETQAAIESAGLDFMGYDASYGKYKVRLRKEDLLTREQAIRGFLQQSASAWGVAPTA